MPKEQMTSIPAKDATSSTEDKKEDKKSSITTVTPPQTPTPVTTQVQLSSTTLMAHELNITLSTLSTSIQKHQDDISIDTIKEIAKNEELDCQNLFDAPLEKVEKPGRQISNMLSEEDILKHMWELHVPDASVTINDGVVEWSRNFSAKSQRAEEVVVQPVFQAGSISKTVNAVLAMKLLVETRIIGLNDDLSGKLGAMGIVNNTGKPITLAQLLSHTAGISKPGFGFLGYHSGGSYFPTTKQILAGNPDIKELESPNIDLKTLDITTNTAPIEVVREPGKECHYSGGGTTIIQKLIEDRYCAAGSIETYASLAKKHIFDPLGMTQSSFEFKMPGTPGTEVLQKGHDENGAVISGDWRIYPELAAAGLWTTSNDLAKFMIAMQDAYLEKSELLLRTETAKQMLSRQPDPGYELCLMSDDPNTKLEPNKLYIALGTENQTLRYSVLTPEGIEVRNKTLSNYNGSIPDPLTTQAVASLDKTKVLESTAKAGDTRYFPFGLGFAVRGEGDAISFTHDGTTIGFQAEFICFPGKKMVAVVMTDSNNGLRLAKKIFSSLELTTESKATAIPPSRSPRN